MEQIHKVTYSNLIVIYLSLSGNDEMIHTQNISMVQVNMICKPIQFYIKT